MVCLCDLFMVIVKLSITGNYFLLSTKGSPELAFVFNLILGKNAFFPVLLLVRISASNISLNKPRHNNCVPLHRPYLGSLFRNNIKGVSFLPLKYVVGYFFEQLSLRIHVDISYEYPLQPHQMTTNYVRLLED
jgi:hypothetical protein